MSEAFASTGDTAEKTISFTEIARDIYAFTAEGDPNTGVVIGDDAVMIMDTQATPVMARQVIDRIRTVTDKPIKYVALSHYHAVRVLGASAYAPQQILASETCLAMIHERGLEDWASEIARFPRLFENAESIPGLTWPNLTFEGTITVNLGKRRVELKQVGRAHTAGDIIAWVPDAGVILSGDTVEYKAACYCGDAYFSDWPQTLDAIAGFGAEALVPGRGSALLGRTTVDEAIELTRDFLVSTYRPVAATAAAGGSLKEAYAACRDACDKKFTAYAIYEHCLPFNVSRAYDEALGIGHPRIWTAERDMAMWQALKG